MYIYIYPTGMQETLQVFGGVRFRIDIALRVLNFFQWKKEARGAIFFDLIKKNQFGPVLPLKIALIYAEKYANLTMAEKNA